MNSPSSRFSTVYLLPGRAESIKPVYEVLSQAFPQVKFFQPCMPTAIRAESVLDWARGKLLSNVKPGSLFVGVGLGGLVAAALQDSHPYLNLSVIVINAPVREDSLILDDVAVPERLAIYSSVREDIRAHCPWPRLTETAFDLPWLQHGIENSKYAVAYLVSAYMRGLNISAEIANFPQVGVGVAQ